MIQSLEPSEARTHPVPSTGLFSFHDRLAADLVRSRVPRLFPVPQLLKQLASHSFALRNCTSRSLLLVDEFGKGTEPDDGAGLFCGMVEYLLAQGPEAVRYDL